jgi:hypothetical protein
MFLPLNVNLDFEEIMQGSDLATSANDLAGPIGTV